ncbi:hypothetical protein O4J56_15690 [Nocardiopsis sp. RSe5-2]|uniref:DUF2868 domain-containing protein n=1 Tax=Nocardiopsis endophytica TaxID=3018445 RepID=A0ABT4U562_9ACTN|nr:hypothetical protein [Nocardiopsis endophytica]MDA2812086.1 hypothetical protein [Nocardiopsis endophytica]
MPGNDDFPGGWGPNGPRDPGGPRDPSGAGGAGGGRGPQGDFPALPGDGFIPLSFHQGSCGCPLEDAVSGRGHFPPADAPHLVANHEMAHQLSASFNATRIIVNRGAELGAFINSVTQTAAAVGVELHRLRLHVRGRPLSTARRRLDELDRVYGVLPPADRVRPGLPLRIAAWTTIAAIGLLEAWFLHRIAVDSLGIPVGEWSSVLAWFMGPILAVLLFALGRMLSSQVFSHRADFWARRGDAAPAGPDPDAPDGALSRARRATAGFLRSWPALPWIIISLLALGWMGFLFLMLARFRALMGESGTFTEDPVTVPPEVFMALFGTFAVGAVVLEYMVHNPYIAARDRAEADYRRELSTCDRLCEAVTAQVSRHRQAHATLRSRRDELLAMARIEVVRAWQCVNLPARFVHGRSGPVAPLTASPTDVLPERPFPDRLTPEEVASYFRVFRDVDTPAPELASLWEAGRVLEESSPEAYEREIRELIDGLARDAEPAAGRYRSPSRDADGDGGDTARDTDREGAHP